MPQGPLLMGLSAMTPMHRLENHNRRQRDRRLLRPRDHPVRHSLQGIWLDSSRSIRLAIRFKESPFFRVDQQVSQVVECPGAPSRFAFQCGLFKRKYI